MITIKDKPQNAFVAYAKEVQKANKGGKKIDPMSICVNAGIGLSTASFIYDGVTCVDRPAQVAIKLTELAEKGDFDVDKLEVPFFNAFMTISAKFKESTTKEQPVKEEPKEEIVPVKTEEPETVKEPEEVVEKEEKTEEQPKPVKKKAGRPRKKKQ